LPVKQQLGGIGRRSPAQLSFQYTDLVKYPTNPEVPWANQPAARQAPGPGPRHQSASIHQGV